MKFALILSTLTLSSFAASDNTAASVEKHSVVIIGAGVSGVYSAKALHAAGITDFIILEGRTDSIGGRLRQAEFPPGSGRHVEIGGNWMEGVESSGPQANPLYPVLQKYGIKNVHSDYSNITYRDDSGKLPNQAEFKARSLQYTNAFDEASKLSDDRRNQDLLDVSLRTAYKIVGWNPKGAMDNAIEWNSFDWEQAETPDVSSLEYTGDLQTFTNFGEDNQFVIDPRGFKHFVEEEAKEIGCGYGSNCLKLGKIVSEINWEPELSASAALSKDYKSQSPVTIKCDDGTVYEADHVIASFSLGVLQSDDVKYVPNLPDWKIQAIDVHHLASYIKIFITFPYKFWDDTEFIWHGSEFRGRFANIQNFDAPAYKPAFPNDHMVLVTVLDQEAFRIQQQSDETTLAEIMAAFKAMYGDNIPQAEHILVPKWTYDPLYRGTFTNWPIGMIMEEYENLVAPLNRLWFTGEHCSLKYFGYVHGAMLAGNQTGNDVASCITSGGDSCAAYPYHTELVNAQQLTRFTPGSRH